MAALLAQRGAGSLFISGCVSNQGGSYDRFDAVVLLSAPVEVLLQRIASRTTHDYGKDPVGLRRILDDVEAVARRATRRAGASTRPRALRSPTGGDGLTVR